MHACLAVFQNAAPQCGDHHGAADRNCAMPHLKPSISAENDFGGDGSTSPPYFSEQVN